MKVLLDENLPKKLKNDLMGHEVITVREKMWNGKTNRELLRLMQNNSVEVLITFDKRLQYQQNFEKYPICVLVLSAKDNTYLTIREFVPAIQQALKKSYKTGVTIIRL